MMLTTGGSVVFCVILCLVPNVRDEPTDSPPQHCSQEFWDELFNALDCYIDADSLVVGTGNRQCQTYPPTSKIKPRLQGKKECTTGEKRNVVNCTAEMLMETLDLEVCQDPDGNLLVDDVQVCADDVKAMTNLLKDETQALATCSTAAGNQGKLDVGSESNLDHAECSDDVINELAQNAEQFDQLCLINVDTVLMQLDDDTCTVDKTDLPAAVQPQACRASADPDQSFPKGLYYHISQCAERPDAPFKLMCRWRDNAMRYSERLEEQRVCQIPTGWIAAKKRERLVQCSHRAFKDFTARVSQDRTYVKLPKCRTVVVSSGAELCRFGIYLLMRWKSEYKEQVNFICSFRDIREGEEHAPCQAKYFNLHRVVPPLVPATKTSKANNKGKKRPPPADPERQGNKVGKKHKLGGGVTYDVNMKAVKADSDQLLQGEDLEQFKRDLEIFVEGLVANSNAEVTDVRQDLQQRRRRLRRWRQIYPTHLPLMHQRQAYPTHLSVRRSRQAQESRGVILDVAMLIQIPNNGSEEELDRYTLRRMLIVNADKFHGGGNTSIDASSIQVTRVIAPTSNSRTGMTSPAMMYLFLAVLFAAIMMSVAGLFLVQRCSGRQEQYPAGSNMNVAQPAVMTV